MQQEIASARLHSIEQVLASFCGFISWDGDISVSRTKSESRYAESHADYVVKMF